jgi:PAS domain S-box-containing protein
MSDKGQEKLSAAEERYKAIFDSTTNGIVTLDLKGNITAINKRFTQIMGYGVEELLGKNFAELEMLAPQSVKAFLEDFPKRMKGVSIPPYEIELTARDGTRLFLELSATPLRERGEIVGDLVVLRDITERKRAEIELREAKEEVERKVEQRTAELRQVLEDLARSEERYRALFEHAPDTVGVFDANNVMQLWNEQAEQSFGYKVEELVGKPAQMIIPKDLLEEAKWLVREVREKGAVKLYETERIKKDGTRIPVELNMAALRDDEGNFTGYIGIGRDISERKRLERELIRAERLAAIGQLASSIAHELR